MNDDDIRAIWQSFPNGVHYIELAWAVIAKYESEAKVDAARLDWMERNVSDITRSRWNNVRICWNNGEDRVFVGEDGHPNWRDAIDAAIASTKKEAP